MSGGGGPLFSASVVIFLSKKDIREVIENKDGKNAAVPGLILTNLKEVSRFQNCLKQIALKKEREYQRSIATFGSIETILSLNQYNVKVELQ